MKAIHFAALVAFSVGAAGCQSQSSIAPSTGNSPTTSTYLVADEPAGAIPVGEARDKSEDGQDVTLVGRIGGSSKPFVDGLAAFTFVDPKVPYCADEEGCPTPWDYCCKTNEVKDNIATVKIVDEAGKPVAQNARDLLKVKELAMVVVKGKAKRSPRTKSLLCQVSKNGQAST
jgi:hypothetical protein